MLAFLRLLPASMLAAVLLAGVGGCKPSVPQVTGQDHPQQEPAVQTLADAKHYPEADDLARFLRAQMPPQLKLLELKNDPPVPLPNAAPGSNVWLYNMRVTFAPAEDLLGPPAPQAAASFQLAVDELDALAAWGQAYAPSPYASRYPSFPAEPPESAHPKLLAVIHAKDKPIAPLYGKMTAEWQVDHWAYAITSLQSPADDASKPRSEYAGPILVQGSPEVEQFLAQIRATVAAAKPKKAAIEAAYRADLLKATQPGTLFQGQLRYQGKVAAVEVRLAAPPAGSDPQQEVQLELRLPDTPGESFTYLAKRARGLPLRLSAPAQADGTTPAPTPEGTEALPKGDLTLSLVRASGKPAHTDVVAAQFLQITRTNAQPASVTLQAHNGRLEGRLNGSGTEQTAFVLSAQQAP